MSVALFSSRIRSRITLFREISNDHYSSGLNYGEVDGIKLQFCSLSVLLAFKSHNLPLLNPGHHKKWDWKKSKPQSLATVHRYLRGTT